MYERFLQLRGSARFVGGGGVIPSGAFRPPKFLLTTHWFSQKYTKNTLLTPLWFYYKSTTVERHPVRTEQPYKNDLRIV